MKLDVVDTNMIKVPHGALQKQPLILSYEREIKAT